MSFTEQLGDMLTFVRETLKDYRTDIENMRAVGYSKFDHTLRVMSWLKRLYEHSDFREEVSFEDVVIAAAFHDTGYSTLENIPDHAAGSAVICREYLEKDGVPEDRIRYITELVRLHSEKKRMRDPETDKGLLLLMEADVIDDTGALSVVTDCRIVQARAPQSGPEKALEHIRSFSYRYQAQAENPMVTPWGRQVWEEKSRLVKEFTAALERDLPDGSFGV